MKSISLMKWHLKGLKRIVALCLLISLILSACTLTTTPTVEQTSSGPSPSTVPSQTATITSTASPTPSETVAPSAEIATPTAETQEASLQPTPEKSMHWVEPEADHAVVFVFQALGGVQ